MHYFAPVLGKPLSLRCPPLLASALLVGTLDITSCSLYWALRGVPVSRVLQGAGTWVLGSAAYSAPAVGAIVGLVVLYALATVFVAGYRMANKSMPRLRQAPLRWGATYGVVVFALMEWVAIPLSAATLPRQVDYDWMLALLSIHVFLIGIPCALCARWMQSLR